MPVFLPSAQAPSICDLADRLRERGLTVNVVGDGQRRLLGLNSLAQATKDEFSFLANPKYISQLAQTGAGCVALTESAFAAAQSKSSPSVPLSFTVLVTDQPYLAFAFVAQWFEAQSASSAPSIHPSAVIASTAHMGANVSIGALVVIEAGAVIEDGCVIGAHTVVGERARVGAHTRLAANVTLYHGVVIGRRAILHSGAVIGSDGFGFAPNPQRGRGAYEKIPQLGSVVIGDDVEIGASTTIDRGALQDTMIGNGVKLDNQIQIGHNVVIGEHTAMAGCVGVAGSAHIGARCTFGGGAIVLGHLSICDDVHVSAATTISTSIQTPGQYTGLYPFEAHSSWEHNAAALRRLSQLRKTVRQQTAERANKSE